TSDQSEQIKRLQNEVATLQAQLVELRSRLSGRSMMFTGENGRNCPIKKRLMRGMNDQEVGNLQEILATDPEIYPEGRKTGYFGQLTQNALLKLQRKAGLAETGVVDEATTAKINELLAKTGGCSGRIPFGLLKKLNPDSISRPKTDTPVVISGVNVSSVGATSAMIAWQTDGLSTGKVHFSLTTPVLGGAEGGGVGFDYVPATTHSLTLNNLRPGTTYYYYVAAYGANSNSLSKTAEASFVTIGQ
ncbi:MAG: peptidoglycan-binding protein, partial [Patescibacteria group bacterium]